MRTQFLLYVLLAAFFWIGSGCGNKKASDLNSDQKDLLKAINESFGDTERAVQKAFAKSAHISSAEKVQKLAGYIVSSGCERKFESDEPISETYTRDWNANQTVKATTCQVALDQKVKYQHSNRQFSMVEVFSSTKDFKKESLVQSYTVEGSLTSRNEGTRTRIQGLFTFKNFKVDKLGLINVRIQTSQSYTGAVGGGSITLTMQARNLNHTASVIWTEGRPHIYRVDGQKVDEKDLMELFSSYGMLEIIDRSQKMR